MSKKSFAKGIDALFIDTQTESEEESVISEPQKIETKKKEIRESAKKEMRTSLNIEEELLNKLHALSYWERKSLKDVWREAAEMYIASRSSKQLNDALKNYQSEDKKPSGNVAWKSR
jgi:hypothetical protein